MEEGDDVCAFRVVSPASSNCRGSQCSQVSNYHHWSLLSVQNVSVILVLQEILQRSVSVEDQRQVPLSSRAQSKTTLNELLDTLKLLEEEPERLLAPKCYHKEKYAWIDEVRLFHL